MIVGVVVFLSSEVCVVIVVLGIGFFWEVEFVCVVVVNWSVVFFVGDLNFVVCSLVLKKKKKKKNR